LNRLQFFKLIFCSCMHDFTGNDFIVLSDVQLEKEINNIKDIKDKSEMVNALQRNKYRYVEFNDIIVVSEDDLHFQNPCLNSFYEYKNSITNMINSINSYFSEGIKIHEENILNLVKFCNSYKDSNLINGILISKLPVYIRDLYWGELNYRVLSPVFSILNSCDYLLSKLEDDKNIIIEEVSWENDYSLYSVSFKSDNGVSRDLIRLTPKFIKSEDLLFKGFFELVKDTAIIKIEDLLADKNNFLFSRDIKTRSYFRYGNISKFLVERDIEFMAKTNNYSISDLESNKIVKIKKNNRRISIINAYSELPGMFPLTISRLWKTFNVKSEKLSGSIMLSQQDQFLKQLMSSESKKFVDLFVSSICYNKNHILHSGKLSENHYMLRNALSFIVFSKIYESLDYLSSIDKLIPNENDAAISFMKSNSDGVCQLSLGKMFNNKFIKLLVKPMQL